MVLMKRKMGIALIQKAPSAMWIKWRCYFKIQSQALKSFAAGYDASGFKATVDSFSNTIKSVQLLSGYNSTVNKEEDRGRRLFEDLDRVIKSFGREYGPRAEKHPSIIFSKKKNGWTEKRSFSSLGTK